MADPVSYSKPKVPLKELHNTKPITKTKKSSSSFTSHILCKSLVFLLFLVLIPLFPSQAPDFVSQSTIFTKFWDLAHLLFIGLAVCYGLFSRRNVEDFDFEPPPQYSDDSQSSYISRIFHVSPIFEDGSENSSGFDDKNVYQNWNSQYYRGDSMVNGTDGHELNKIGSQYYKGEPMVDFANGNEENKSGSLGAENGFENSFENGDSDPIQAWNSQYSQYYRGESMVNGANGHELNKIGSQYHKGESMVDFANGNEQNKSGSLGAENGFENSFENGDSDPIQAWNSQYFQGESMVVVSQPNHLLDEYGNLGQVNGFRPLGLPNSRIKNLDSSQFSNGSESGRGLSGLGLSDGSGRRVKENDFGDMSPTNLEARFNENAALPSQIRWHSRSERKEIREKVGSFTEGSSHFRPLSVDETQFESLQSQSFRSTTSLSSQGSSASYSPTTLSPSHSVSSELPNSETEELGENKSYRASYPPTSQSPATRKADAPLNAFHLRRYSSGSLFQKDSRKSLKNGLKDLKGKRNEDAVSSREAGQGSLGSDQKPATPVKTSSLKGKSVRTIRASRYSAETMKAGEMSRNHVDDKAGNICDEAQTGNIGKNEMKRGPDNMLIGTDKQKSDTQHYVPKPTLSKYKKKENEVYIESVTVDSTEDSENKIDKSPVSSDEDSMPATNNDTGYDSSEVDKKAGEFIAKFREQIRLQKVASIERSKGKRMLGKR
ncbi:unnamed protein product [Dovyalis caffra]|uniref:Uncharacterized protein n=1 Tax=Dovyalis caffra TaxID=77055 RepID=A0AAV1SC53_9ROSI|nr:unnamed protein product [Dovyalis caffra]